MHPRLAELIEYAAKQRAGLLAAVDAAPMTLRDIKTGTSAWSVAEVLEHLYRVETGIVRLLERGVQRARAAGAPLEQEHASMLGSLDAFRLTDRTYVAAAPEPVMPRGDLTAAACLAGQIQSISAQLRAETDSREMQ
jgi:uncharacterized damage-inducible protein DinB